MGNASRALTRTDLAGRDGRHSGLRATLTHANALDGDALA
jgi:hypothetical protein